MFDAALKDNPTRRRVLWITVSAVGAAGALWWERTIHAADSPAAADSGEGISVVAFSDAGARIGIEQVHKITRSESDWRGRLTAEQYSVTRDHSTDTPFTGTYYQIHEDGIFRCVCCATALFSSTTKFDSGSGWPAFAAPIASENVREAPAPGITREAALDVGIEVLCKRCDAHLGHIFDDGPPPANLRYCINESALQFVARKG